MDNEKALLVVREMMTQLQKLEQALTESARSVVFPPERMKLVEQRICLICEKPIEDGQRSIRAAHEPCYKSLKHNVIDRGMKTDDEAIEAGLLLPRDTGGRKPKQSDLLEKFDAKKVANEIREAKKTKKKGTE